MRHMGFHEDGLGVKRVIDPTKKGKLEPNRKGPYRVRQRLNNGAYKLESVEGV